MSGHYYEIDAIKQITNMVDVPERSLKRRFKSATGNTLIGHLQNLRIEEAKRLLEEDALPIDEVSVEVGYMDVSFFRRLFKRLTGLSPGQYRRMFQPLKLSDA
jgi:transcriptional regulator GlxA family with amidase domain